jgi:hypothetical protein
MFLSKIERRKKGKTYLYWSVVEDRHPYSDRVGRRDLLHFGEINSSQAEAGRRAIEVSDEDEGRSRSLAPFPPSARSARHRRRRGFGRYLPVHPTAGRSRVGRRGSASPRQSTGLRGSRRDWTRPPLTSSPILTFTTSHPRNLLSIAKSNIARSRRRYSRSSQNRIAQTCCGFSARFAPCIRSAFQWRRP